MTDHDQKLPVSSKAERNHKGHDHGEGGDHGHGHGGVFGERTELIRIVVAPFLSWDEQRFPR